jgi:hypothetical protein
VRTYSYIERRQRPLSREYLLGLKPLLAYIPPDGTFSAHVSCLLESTIQVHDVLYIQEYILDTASQVKEVIIFLDEEI